LSLDEGSDKTAPNDFFVQKDKTPKPGKSLVDAYNRGRADAKQYGTDSLMAFDAKVRNYDAEYPDYEDPARIAFWEAGLLGHDIPKGAIAVRIGKIPKDDRSYNFRDQQFEHGVSVLHLLDEERKDNGTYDLFNKGERRLVSGFVVPHRTGADGEPLLVGTEDLGEFKGSPSKPRS
jgi:hypothetical protein